MDDNLVLYPEQKSEGQGAVLGLMMEGTSVVRRSTPCSDDLNSVDASSIADRGSSLMSSCSGSSSSAGCSFRLQKTAVFSVADSPAPPQSEAMQQDSHLDSLDLQVSRAFQQMRVATDSHDSDSQPVQFDSKVIAKGRTPALLSRKCLGHVSVGAAGDGLLPCLDKSPLLSSQDTAAMETLSSSPFPEAEKMIGSCDQPFGGGSSPGSTESCDSTLPACSGSAKSNDGSPPQTAGADKEAPCGAAEQSEDRSQKKTADRELIPDRSVETECDSDETEVQADTSDTDVEDMHSDGLMESQAPCAEELLKVKSKSCQDKENMVRKCSVVLIRQQHALTEKNSKTLKTKFSKGLTSKRLVSSVLKRERPSNHKQVKERSATALPVIKDCFVLLDCEEMSVKSECSKPFTEFSKTNSELPASVHSHRNRRIRRSSFNSEPNTAPLRDCFVLLNQKEPSFTANHRGISKNEKQSLKSHQVLERKRPSAERNSAVNSETDSLQSGEDLCRKRSTGGKKLATKSATVLKSTSHFLDHNHRGRSSLKSLTSGMLLRDCYVVLSQNEPAVTEGVAGSFRNKDLKENLLQARQEGNRSYQGGHSAARKSVLTTAVSNSANDQRMTECFVVIRRDQVKLPPVQNATTNVKQSVQCCGQNEDRPAAKVLTDLWGLRDCCVVLQREKSVTEKKRVVPYKSEQLTSSFPVSIENRLLREKSSGRKSIDDKPLRSCFVSLTHEVPDTRKSYSRTLESTHLGSGAVVASAPESAATQPVKLCGKVAHVKGSHACVSHASALPQCFVVLSPLPASTCTLDSSKEEENLSKFQVLRRKSSNTSFLHGATGETFSGSCLSNVEEVEAKTYKRLRECFVSLKSLQYPSAKKGRPAKSEQCDHSVSDPVVGMERAEATKRGICGHADSSATEASPKSRASRSRKERVVDNSKPSKEDCHASRSATDQIPWKECSIVLTRLQGLGGGKIDVFMDMPVLQLPAQEQSLLHKGERPIRDTASVEKPVSDVQRRTATTTEESVPQKRGRSAKSVPQKRGRSTKDMNAKSPSVEPSISGKRRRPLKTDTTKTITGMEKDIPPNKKAKQSKNRPAEQGMEDSAQDIDVMKQAAGIWIKPFSEHMDTSQDMAVTQEGSALPEATGPVLASDSNTEVKKAGLSEMSRQDFPSKSGLGKRKRGHLLKSEENVEQKCPKQGSGERTEQSDKDERDSDLDKILFVGEDFIVVEEKSDSEEDDEAMGKEAQRDLSKDTLQEECIEKTHSEEEAGKKVSGGEAVDDCSIAINLDETDGSMYMQLLPLEEEGL